MSAKYLRLARLIEIIHIVSCDPTWSANKLAAYFEISEKRIYDDLKELNAANIPIVFDSRFGGYALLRKTRIPTGIILDNMSLGIPQQTHERDRNQWFEKSLPKKYRCE